MQAQRADQPNPKPQPQPQLQPPRADGRFVSTGRREVTVVALRQFDSLESAWSRSQFWPRLGAEPECASPLCLPAHGMALLCAAHCCLLPAACCCLPLLLFLAQSRSRSLTQPARQLPRAPPERQRDVNPNVNPNVNPARHTDIRSLAHANLVPLPCSIPIPYTTLHTTASLPLPFPLWPSRLFCLSYPSILPYLPSDSTNRIQAPGSALSLSLSLSLPPLVRHCLHQPDSPTANSPALHLCQASRLSFL